MSIALFKPKQIQPTVKKRFWLNQDIAEFYRATDILKQAGLNTEVDSGVTDEGDPWFVFVRPESGDVIAHFAQIDGVFVAVSSLNREVYRGKDIRGIVDQMLNTHPMLLPKNKSGGRLLIHPTAALTAFLAAAFILNIDGVKASNLGEILNATVFDNNTGIDYVPGAVENAPRSELTKSMFADLSSSSYNVAILGVALIAHELSLNETVPDEDSELVAGLDRINVQKDESNDNSDRVVTIESEQQRGPEYDNNNLTQSFDTFVALASETEIGKASDKEGHTSTKVKVKYKQELTLQESSNEGVTSLPSASKDGWNNNDLTFFAKNEVNNTNAVIQNHIRLEGDSQFDLVSQVGSTGIGNISDLNLTVLMKNFKSAFQASFVSDAVLLPDNLDDVSVSTGAIKVLSMQPLTVYDVTNTPQQETLPAFGGLFTEVEQIENNLNPLASNSFQENELIEVKQIDPVVPVYEKPIIGHSLKNTGEVLRLTDAIDVVFYTGGNEKITGFELGTDLLWFFLSEEELMSSQSTVNLQGDLEINFGDVGTLTFLGIVTETPMDLVV
jgi:hypothetical protein